MFAASDFDMKGSITIGVKKEIFLAAVSGVLMILAFPRWGLSYLAWVGLIPLLLALRGATPKKGFLLGAFFGIIHFAGLLYWVVLVMTTYGKLPWPVSIGILVLMVAYLCLYPGVFGAVLAWVGGKNFSWFFWAPALWVSLEFGRAKLMTGFPWELLGYSQWEHRRLIQGADLFGVYGLSFLIVWVNSFLFQLIRSRGKERMAFLWKGGLTAGGLLAAFLIYGEYRINQVEQTISRAGFFQAAIVQPNIDQSLKWVPAFQDESLDRLSAQTKEANRIIHQSLVVWPETAVPFYFLHDGRRSLKVTALAREMHNFLLFGSPAARKESGRDKLFNRAYLLSPEGTVAGVYDKQHLVPFGEYVPLKPLLPFVGKIVEAVGDFEAGNRAVGLPLGGGKVGVMICFESIFPEIGLAFKKAGATLLANLTNDAWFGRSSAPFQHFSMGVFRAVENRVFFLRAANTGVSGIVDPTGKVLFSTPLFEKAVITGRAAHLDIPTWYSFWGDLWVYLCIGITFFMAGWIFLAPFITFKQAKE
jgi:apolipoprotein N-acyltransferase